MKKNKTNITAIILTKNEETQIERCINSIKSISDRIIVVDSKSTDNTTEIAKKCGAEVYEHEFVTHGQQFNWALDNLDIGTEWILRVDADEIITDKLATEIVDKCKNNNNNDISAYNMKFKVYFLGKFLKYGGAYPFIKINLFKFNHGRFDDRPMRDNLIISNGKIGILDNDALHFDQKDISAYVSKHNWYSSMESQEYINNNNNNKIKIGKKAKKRSFIRDNFYYKLPLFFRARLFYYYKYYFKLGFLDGKPGKIYAFISTYCYRYLVDAKIYESRIEKGFDINENISD